MSIVFLKRLVPLPIVSFFHLLWAFGSALVFGFPSRELTVIGVTGTKGKTTVTELLAKILETAGHTVAVANGLHFKIGDMEEPNLLKMTMPGRGKIQRFLRRAVYAGAKYAILEVTSEGIKQHRHHFIKFDVAAITNLHEEHIEAHGSFEAYREAKGRLFRACGNIHVLNTDDPQAGYFRKFPAKQKLEFSSQDFEKFRAVQPPSLPGEFNLYNIAGSAKIAAALGIPDEIVKKAVAEFPGVPGRMEFVQREPFAVIVDYAHTPDSLEEVYKFLSLQVHKSNQGTYQLNNLQTNKLICVLGAAGGGRDKWKRPVMGEIASKYCDMIFLTNEDPYDEDPEQIIADIEKGIYGYISQTNKILTVAKILDRREAIQQALRAAKPDDAVVITGKGAEQWMAVQDGRKIPWDDREVVREILKKIPPAP